MKHSVFKGTGLHPEIKNENRCDDMQTMFSMISKKKNRNISKLKEHSSTYPCFMTETLLADGFVLYSNMRMLGRFLPGGQS